jgi:hypothetical protein
MHFYSPGSVQSPAQVQLVQQLAMAMRRGGGMALPHCGPWTLAYGGGLSLRQLLQAQRRFLPNDQALLFAHVPKVIDSICQFFFKFYMN